MTTLPERLQDFADDYPVTCDLDRKAVALLLEAAQALQAQEGEWRTIDSAPKDGETVYLFYIWETDEFGLGIRPIGCPDDAAASIFPHIAIYPTHWRPLPTAPSPSAALQVGEVRFVACRCVSERDRELCMNKGECSKVYAYSDTSTKEPTK